MLPHENDVERRLAELVHLAADWVQGLDALLPADDGEAARVWAAPSRDAVEDKVLAEAAILLDMAVRTCGRAPSTGGGVRAGADRLLAALAGRARPARHREMLRRAPHSAWPVGITHAVLERHGAPDPDFDRFFRACLKLGWSDAVDRLVFRSLEVRWAQALLDGGPPVADDLLALAPTTTAPPFATRREEVYAFTHTFFYATDFGRHPLPGTPDPAEIARRTDAFLAWQLWEDDLDLLGELLMVVHCCGLPSRYATTVLSVAWPDLCTPVVRGPHASFTDDELRATGDRRVFGRCYHTTFVTGMLCATALLRWDHVVGLAGTGLDGDDRALVTRESLDALRLVGEPDRLRAAWTTRVEDVPDRVGNVLGCVLDGATAVVGRTGDHAATRSLVARREALCGEVGTTGRAAQALLELDAMAAELAAADRGGR